MSYQVLVEHLIALCLILTSTYLLLRLLWGIGKRQIFNKNVQQNITMNQNVSRVLLINFVCWTLTGLTFIPHILYMIATWQYKTSFRDDADQIFWTGVFPHCMLATLTITVLCQTIDRTFFVTFPMGYSIQRQNVFWYFSVICCILCFCLNFWDMSGTLPLPESTRTNSFSWLVEREDEKVMLITRVGGGFFILICGCFLLVKIRKIQNQNKANQVIIISSAIVPQTKPLKNKKFVLTANQLVILQMCTEVVLQFIPQTTALILLLFGITLGRILGPYNILFASIDMTSSMMIYYNKLGRFLRKDHQNSG